MSQVTWDSSPQLEPPAVLVRVRLVEPVPPQGAVQVLHAPHSEYAQFESQALLAEHVPTSTVGPQGWAPWEQGTSTDRDRLYFPSPQGEEHVSQEPQGDISHCTGQGCALHARVSARAGQFAAATAAGSVGDTTVRVWVVVPPPQDLVQALQVDQGDTTHAGEQSTVQVEVSLRGGQGAVA